jgi:hypothetical protein
MSASDLDNSTDFSMVKPFLTFELNNTQFSFESTAVRSGADGQLFAATSLLQKQGCTDEGRG